MTALRTRRGSLSALARRLLVLAVIVTLTAAVLVGVAVRLQALARAEVVDVLDPTSLSVEQLRAAALDQETGIRGYALEANTALLEPYLLGRDREAGVLSAIREQLATMSQSDIHEGVELAEERLQDWRAEVADPLIDERNDQTVQVVIEQSRPLFDEVRAAFDSTDRAIDSRRTEARADLSNATRLLVISLLSTFAIAVAGIAGCAWVLNRRVIEPVTELNARTLATASGEFTTELDIRGVAEVEELAASITSMRNRIRADLEQSEAARQLLDEQAEELARSNRDLEQFAYVASHDLQEPLRKVASFCELLEDRYSDELDDRGRTYIGFAVDGARRMQALISDLLQFSRVGRTTDEFEHVELSNVVDDVVAQFSQTIDSTNATITVESLPAIEGDRSLLIALFSNLVSNALRYRSEEDPTIEIAADDVGDHWAIRVTDNGIGIPPEYAEKVFVIFQRLHTREEYGGTGIGLSLCKKIVEFHRGDISVVDRSGTVGAQILMTFPKIADESIDDSPATTPAPNPEIHERD